MNHPPNLCTVIAALAILALPASAAPLITEFLAVNNSGLLDEDNSPQDWIEIHNPDAEEVDLGGYHLTDNAALPTRWTIPDGVSLPAGAYLVVFASGKDRTDPGQNLHANFSLGSGGEYLGIYAPGGLGAALHEYAPQYPVQTGDVSYGLLEPVPGSASVYFTTPTPGAPNSPSTAPAETVAFTPASGTFASGTTLEVALGVDSPTATIRYTTNRSLPIRETGIVVNVTASATTDLLTSAAHGLEDGDQVRISSTGSLPAPLVSTLDYFVAVVSASTFQLSIAPGGAPLDLTSAGSGTLSVRRDASVATAATSDLFSTTAAHTFLAGDPVEVTTTGSLPAPLVAGATYYVVVETATSFRLSASPTLSPLVNITTTGSGTHTVRRRPSPLYAGAIPVTENTRIRARAYEPGRPDGPLRGEIYFALDAAAQAFTSNVPIVVSHTWNTAMANDVTVESHMMIFEPKDPDNLARMTNAPDLAAPCTLERRGSSTAGDPKYSLTLELRDEWGQDRNFDVLGMPSESDWVMHAPYNFDRSLLHNDLIYRLSNDVGRYAVRTRFVEHFHNTQTGSSLVNGATTAAGDYFGVYSFMEKITRGNDRVDVENLRIDDNTPPAVEGGYMFKVDRLDPGDNGITALPGQSFGGVGSMGWIDPKENSLNPALKVTTAQSNYLRGYIGSAWAALSGSDFMDPVTGYAAYFDVAAAIDHQILNICTKNADANRLSAYWHKPRSGKLTAGPIWDFDRAQGSTDGRDFNWGTWRGDTGDLGTDFFHYPWYNEMFRDPNFWQQFIDRFHELRQSRLSTAEVHARIDEFVAQVNPGNAAATPAKRNISRWGQNPRGAGNNSALTNNSFNGQYTGEIAWLKHWWASRLAFMDGQFTRPAVSNVPSGPVPAGSAVVFASPSLSTPGVTFYYTTDGTDPRPAATAPELGSGSGVTVATLIPEISTVRAIVPTGASVGGPTGIEWRNHPFNDSGWYSNNPGTINGVGYDDDLGVSYLPYIGLRWSTAANPIAPNNASNTMRNTNGSCYIRHVFNVSEAEAALLAAPNKLVLQIRYDDGYYAWINGGAAASISANASGNPNPSWNTVLGSNQEATSTYQDVDITASMGRIVAGENVLAFQLVNGSNTGSSDILLGAKLVIQSPPPPYDPPLSPSAIEYTGPLDITEPTHLFVRTVNPVRPSDPPTQGGGGTGAVPNGSSWSAPTEYYYFPGAEYATQANIRITEVHYHPDPPTPAEVSQGWTASNDFEFIRLTNSGATPVDLTGIFFSMGVVFTAAEGLQNWLPAGASVVVVENAPAFVSRYGDSFTLLGQYSGALDDGGERIVLNDRNGNVISDFTYDDGLPWPTEADRGYSLVHVAGDPSLPESWRASLDPGGTSANTYARWLARYFPGADPGSLPMTGNNDGDVLNNLGEYAFGTDPRVAGGAENAIVSFLPGEPALFAMRRRAGATDVTYFFESSGNLGAGNWTPPVDPPLQVIDNGDGTETVLWEIPGLPEGVPLYMRARVTSP